MDIPSYLLNIDLSYTCSLLTVALLNEVGVKMKAYRESINKER